MAIYKLFPEKDSTIYSDLPLMNTGRDEILELRNEDNSLTGLYNGVSRIVIKFTQSQIEDLVTNVIGNGTDFSASLKLYLATADNLPLSFNIECYPISGSWEMGRGKYKDIPQNTEGVSWTYRNANVTSSWQTASFTQGVTASFSNVLSYLEQSGVGITSSVASPFYGGGNWWFSSSIYGYAISSSQEVGYNNVLDLNLDVSNTVKEWVSSSLDNQGFIVKLPDSIEFSSNYFSLKYFSRDTHTVYLPVLEMKWDDSQYSSSLPVLNESPFVCTLRNNGINYTTDSIQRFRVNIRPQYPVRTFSTSSAYVKNYILPSSSYYEIRDLHTGEAVIGFDNNFTKISADNTSNYFDVYMSGLQPERWYSVCIKSQIDGSTVILENDMKFRVNL